MLIIETKRCLFRLVEAYYVQKPEDVHSLTKCLSINKVIYIRQAPILLDLDRFEAWYRPFPTVLLDLRRDLGALFREASRTSRNRIGRIDPLSSRAAIRRNGAAAYADFLTLHNDFVARNSYTEPLSKSQIDRLRPVVDVFVAYFDGRALCGHVFIRDQDVRRVELLFSASVRLERSANPAFVSWMNRWLHWSEIRLYKSEGMLVYDFGGTATDTPRRAGIARFKQSFGGTRVVEHSYLVARPLGRMAISMFYAVRRIRSAKSFFGASGLFEHTGWTDIRRTPIARRGGNRAS
jgi:hypothetical protein